MWHQTMIVFFSLPVWFLLSPKVVLTAGLLFDFDNLVWIIADFGTTNDQSDGDKTLKARGGLVPRLMGQQEVLLLWSLAVLLT